jgi:hypothetical protein
MQRSVINKNFAGSVFKAFGDFILRHIEALKYAS